MKSLTRVILALALVHGLSADFCKRELMGAYFLDGLLEPNDVKHPLCPAIKRNCCTSSDIIKIYDKFANILKPKLAELKVKFRDSLRKLERLHSEVFRLTPRDNWQGKQKLFCQNSMQEFSAFRFKELVDDLRRGFEMTHEFFGKAHTGFLCFFCDYEAQIETMLSTMQAGIDSSLCLDALNHNKQFMTDQNIKLVEYFMKMQTTLDCIYFDDKFNLPFTFGSEQTLAEDFDECFDKLTPESLDKTCAPLCSQLRFGAISPVYEGNYFFIDRAYTAYMDQIRSIKTKERMTPFNPLMALQKLNTANPNLKFFNINKEKMNKDREDFMDQFNNKFKVNENNNDDVFRNDEMIYPPTEEEDNKFDQDITRNPNKLMETNRDGWEKFYKDKMENQSRRKRKPELDLFGNEIQTNQSSAPNIFDGIHQGVQAVGNVVNNIGQGIGNAVSNIFKPISLPRLFIRRLKARGINPVTFQKQIARKLIQQGNNVVPVVDVNGNVVILKNGDSMPNGITNVNGVLMKNGKSLFGKKKQAKKATKKVQKVTVQKKKVQKAIVKKSKKMEQETVLKMAKKLVLESQKQKQELEKKKIEKIKARLEKKLGKKLSIKIEKKAAPKKAAKKVQTVSEAPQTAAQVLERDAIKALLGKPNVPKAEQDLLQKMAKMIDNQFANKSKNSKKQMLAAKAKRHTRLLEALFDEESQDMSHSHHPHGRILSEPAQDPRQVLNPIAYYTDHYESINFLQNATSLEIFKSNQDSPDVTRFSKKYIFNQGVNIKSYIETLAFDLKRTELILLLSGSVNLDKFDGEMEAILKTCNRMFIINTIRALVSEYTAIVTPERLSDDDKELARAEPVYDEDEIFDVVDKKYFDDSVIARLDRELPNAYLAKRPVSSRQLRDVSETPAQQMMSELRNTIRPSLLIPDKRPHKEVF